MKYQDQTRNNNGMNLTAYRKKRKFNQTPEPSPSLNRQANKGRLRFVVQKHQASHLHYDFRLEHQGVLLSWAVPKGPSMHLSEKRLAMAVEDHPLDYINFHGVIPAGNYGAGTVEIWDRGNYELLSGSRVSGQLKFILHGRKLKGKFALVKIKGKFGGRQNSWLLIKEKDKYAKK